MILTLLEPPGFDDFHKSEVVLGSFWLMLPGLGPNRQTKVFRWSFYWKLDSSPSLLSLWSTF